MDAPLTDAAVVAALVLVATLIQGSIGFGFAMIFTPLATLAIGPRDAVATSIIVGTVVSVSLYTESRPRAPLRSVAPMAVTGVLAMPLGLLLLTSADESLLRVLVGSAVLLGAAVNLWTRSHQHAARDDRPGVQLAAGVVAGVLRGATSMGGPPIVLYQHWVGGGSARIRSRLFAFFVLFGVPGIPLAALAGVLTPRVVAFAGAGLVTVALGTFAARWIRPRLPEPWFSPLSMLLLATTSVVAVAGAMPALLSG